ncbi:hypothetical protein D9611_010261 [Ephemerocybe angulata]|uniref:Uncharacterized protein n=1 Tax=Ephemerocybe angulata TaxID=980116 RepID=A0A8H5F1Q5_9AGAR|nr:hypothetical protein D9611_010261 [Tulosesus angulatus]
MSERLSSICKGWARLLPRVLASKKRAPTDLKGDDLNHEAATTQLSCFRRVAQSTITATDILASVAETLPLVGSPLKGALEAICKILKLVETRYQSTEMASELSQRLSKIIPLVISAPNCDSLVSDLHSHLVTIEKDLARLTREKGIGYASVAQYISDCSRRIDSAMTDFLTLREIRQTAGFGMDFVIVMDPFGFPQKIMKQDVTSIEFVGQIILNRYNFNPAMREVLKPFVVGGHFEVGLDNHYVGIEAMQSEDLPSLAIGSKAVMNVIALDPMPNMLDYTELMLDSNCQACGTRQFLRRKKSQIIW